MLDAETIARLKHKLETELAELVNLETDDAEAKDTIELDQSRVGRLSRMDALANAQMSAETQRRRSIQLAMIKKALAKINLPSAQEKTDVTSYGECEECLQAINLKRLEHNPAATLCIDCATAAEN